jgi:L-fucose isomerase-like protein
MYTLQLAADKPSVIADWNNNYGDEPDKAVLWHCGNWAASYMPDAVVDQHPILEAGFGPENTWGAMHGRTPPGPITFARIRTDDLKGRIRAFVGEGVMTADPLDTWGTRAVAEIPDLQGLLAYICRQGYEHHVAVTSSAVGAAVGEAMETYLGWDVYRHRAP